MKKLTRFMAILALLLFLATPAIAINWDGYYTNMLIKGYLGGPKGDTMDNMTANYWKVNMSSASGVFNVLTGNLKVGAGTPDVTLNGVDAYVTGTLEVDGVTRFDGATMTLRGVAYTIPAADGGASTYLQTNGSGTLSWAAGTSGTLDDAYNSGKVITVDGAAVQLDGSHGSNDTFFVNKTAGTGDAIQITNAGTGYDINGTSGTWYITKAGVATFASFGPLTSGLTISGGVVSMNTDSNFATNINTGSSSGAVTIGGGSGTVAVNSSSWDISTTGAISGVSTIGMSGDLTLSAGDIYLANGKAVKSSTTTAQTVKLQGYDVDNTTYRDVLTITNGDTITAVLGSGNETFSLNSADWDISTTGDMTGIGAVTMNGLLTGTLGATVSGATVSLNNDSNFAVNVGTGTSTGTVTIGGAGVQSIDIGNGAAAKTVALGSSNTTSTTTLLSGSGGLNLNVNTNQPVNVGTGTSTGTVTVGGAGAQAIDIGNGAAVKTVALGSDNSTSATTIKAGTGDMTITSVDDLTINGGSAGSIITIGGNTDGNVINIGADDTTADTIGIGSAKDTSSLAGISVTVGSTGTTSTAIIQSGSGGVAINASNNQPTNIGTGTTTGTVTIGGAGAQAIDIGNGAAAKTVALGSSNTTSTTTILSGSGAVNVNASNNQPTNINTGTSTGTTTIGNANSFVTVAGVITGANPLVFDGSTADASQTTISFVDPTADRTVTVPNATGTLNMNCTATHDYAGGAVDWTLSVAEMQCGYITVTNANGAVNAYVPTAVPGKTYTVNNGSGFVLTFKVTGQTGGTLANGKWGLYTTLAADVAEVYELP